MRIVIASDHAGFELKQAVRQFVAEVLGLDISDYGTHNQESCDFPGYAVHVAGAVVRGEADLGILICGTGIGMCVAANKVPGAVAALCSEEFSARAARAHNDARILCLGGRVIGPELAKSVVRAFLSAERDDTGRHMQRRQQIAELDSQRGGETA
jgi:ribose 5-phosphate isomerase B